MGTNFGVWVALGLLVAGCSVPGSETPPGVEPPPPIPPGQGQLVVHWKPGADDGASPGTAWAAAHADLFEAVLVGADETRIFEIQGTKGPYLSLSPGTYRLILLAGMKRSTQGITVYLVGSALAEGVKVVQGQRVPVELTLVGIDMAWKTSGPAMAKETFGVSMAGKTRNPRLGMSLVGTLTTQRPRFQSSGLWYGYHEANRITGTPDNWVAEASGTAPDGVPSLTVGFCGPIVVYQGNYDTWYSLGISIRHSWHWPNRAEVEEDYPLTRFTELSVPCVAPPAP